MEESYILCNECEKHSFLGQVNSEIGAGKFGRRRQPDSQGLHRIETVPQTPHQYVATNEAYCRGETSTRNSRKS